jgi:predicted alpha/beta superfamily hydrolase
LSWSTGTPTVAAGNVYTCTVSGGGEWKPLLDDATWARGPNYRVADGATIDIWPHFVTTMGRVVTLLTGFHGRDVYAYLPPSYDENTEATYPVVYMHDGQNLWAALPQLAFGGTWNVDSAFDLAAENGSCSAWSTAELCTGDGDCAAGRCVTFPEAIVIGIGNTAQRVTEYTPPGADAYLQLLVDELKPTVDAMLRTRPDVSSTAMAGSSLGGLVTAYAGVRQPRVFGRLAAMSPSSWWDGGEVINDVFQTPAAPDRPLLVYVDCGSGAVDDEVDTRALAAAYAAVGVPNRYVVQDGGQHTELYWRQRFPGAMQYVLGER